MLPPPGWAFSRESADRHTATLQALRCPLCCLRKARALTGGSKTAPEEDGHRSRSGLGTQAGRRPFRSGWSPRPLGPAGSSVVASAFAEAAKAKEQPSSEFSLWLSLAECVGDPPSRGTPLALKARRSRVYPCEFCVCTLKIMSQGAADP